MFTIEAIKYIETFFELLFFERKIPIQSEFRTSSSGVFNSQQPFYLVNSKLSLNLMSLEDDPIISSKSPGSATHSNF